MEKKSSVGVARKGIVVKDQGYVPYNDNKKRKRRALKRRLWFRVRTGAWVTQFAAERLKSVNKDYENELDS